MIPILLWSTLLAIFSFAIGWVVGMTCLARFITNNPERVLELLIKKGKIRNDPR